MTAAEVPGTPGQSRPRACPGDAGEPALVLLEGEGGRPRPDRPRGPRVIDTISDAYIVVDGSGLILDWNVPAERTFGWAGDDVAGRVNGAAVVPALGLLGCQPSSTPTAPPGTIVLGQPVETSALRRDGRVLPVRLTVWACDDDEGDGRAYHAFVHDLSGRGRPDEDRVRLAAIVSSCVEPIIGLGSNGQILTWNGGAERLFGYTAAEVIGRPVTVLAPAGHGSEMERLERRTRAGAPGVHVETKGLRNNGVELDVAVTFSPVVDGAGAQIGTSLVVRDVTEERWIARTLDTALASLEDALRECKGSEARLRRLTGDVAHQLRTPLAGIRACVEAMLEDPPLDERESLLGDVIRETSRASGLMGGLLQMARIDQGQPLNPVRCDVAGLCAEEAARVRALNPNLEVEVRLDDAPAAWPEIDPHAVHEILANLLDNARRHTLSRIELAVRAVGDQFEVCVADDGPGVPDALCDRIFERFVSLDAKGGSGLGLPIARGLAEAHGGTLTYQRPAFLLRLPQKAARHCGGASNPDFDQPQFKRVVDWEHRDAP